MTATARALAIGLAVLAQAIVPVDSRSALREVGPGKPFATIQGALDDLWDARGSAPFPETERVLVYGGTYREQAVPYSWLVPTAENRLVIEAAPGEAVVVDGENARDYGFDVWVDYTTIRRIQVRGTVRVGVQIIRGTGAIIEDVSASDNGVHGVNVEFTAGVDVIRCVADRNVLNGINLAGCSDASLESCTADDNGNIGIMLSSGPGVEARWCKARDNGQAGIWLGATESVVADCVLNSNGVYGLIGSKAHDSSVLRCVASDNLTHGIDMDRCGSPRLEGNVALRNGHSGIIIPVSADAEILHNTVSGNGIAGIYVYFTAPRAWIQGNVIVSDVANATGLYIDSSSTPGVVSDGNDLWASGGGRLGWWETTFADDLDAWRALSGQDGASISADPETHEDGHHLLPWSACVGAGLPLGFPSRDRDGEARDDASPDLGADEFLHPRLRLAALPFDDPVLVPPEGGRFHFTVELSNPNPYTVSTSGWTRALLPEGGALEPLAGPVPLELAPDDSLSLTTSQSVPSGAPAGTYGFEVALGEFPETWAATAST
ncbi:MAG: right-handed parallel beta-helix repeat-containing protein [Planctomycetota bacterium]|nr:right-handed parallel beta-helix repeat-containing protein [Planctomycetota bacterium]